MNKQSCTWPTFSALLLIMAASNIGHAATTQVTTTPTIDFGVKQHVFTAGETFDYYYEDTESTYATIQAAGGKTPRITDLKSIADVAVQVRVTIVSVNGKLMKKIELRNLRVRTVNPTDIVNGFATVPFQPIQTQVPNFPDTFTFSYAVGQDGQTAGTINTIFKDYQNPAFGKLIDIFTFLIGPSHTLPTDGIGSVRVTPGVDVQLNGTTFHSASQTAMYNRVDWFDGQPQAYFKVQSPGNYFAAYGVETNIQNTYHVPLLGKAKGLITLGDLQEQIFVAAPTGSAVLRQVSITMQTLGVDSAINALVQP